MPKKWPKNYKKCQKMIPKCKKCKPMQKKCEKMEKKNDAFQNFQDFRPGFLLACAFAFDLLFFCISVSFFLHFFLGHFLGMSSTMNSTARSALFESRIWNAKRMGRKFGIWNARWKSYPNSWAENPEFRMQDGPHTQSHGGMQKQIPCHNPVCGSESHIRLATSKPEFAACCAI